MIRIVGMTKMYGTTISSIEDDLDNIMEFVNNGEPVILVNDIEDLERLDIDPNDVEMI